MHFADKPEFLRIGIHGFTLLNLLIAHACKTGAANGFVDRTYLEVFAVLFKDLDVNAALEALERESFLERTQDGCVLSKFLLENYLVRSQETKPARTQSASAPTQWKKPEMSPDIPRKAEDRGKEYRDVFLEAYELFPKRDGDSVTMAEPAFQTAAPTIEVAREILAGIKLYVKENPQQSSSWFYTFMRKGLYEPYVRAAKGLPIIDAPVSESGYDPVLAFEGCWDEFRGKWRGVDKKTACQTFVELIKTQAESDVLFEKIKLLNNSLNEKFDGHTFINFLSAYQTWQPRTDASPAKAAGYHKVTKGQKFDPPGEVKL